MGEKNKHIKRTHPKEENPENTCYICGKNSKSRLDLKRHVQGVPHDSEEVCPICGISVKRLHQHMTSVHANESDKLTCDSCGYVAKNKKYLYQHIQRTHTDPGDYKHVCDKCGKKLKTPNQTHR